MGYHRNCKYVNIDNCPGKINRGYYGSADECEFFELSETKKILKTIRKIDSQHISNQEKIEKIISVLENNC